MSKRFALVAVVLALLALCASGAAGAAGFNQFVGLGDSTLDTGYLRYHTSGDAALDSAIAAAVALGAKGGWAGNGVMNTTILAGKFGLDAATIGDGGTNYAVGGAYTTMARLGLVPSTQQVANYLASVGGVANPSALYIVSSGNNDLIYASQNVVSPNFLHEQAIAWAAAVARLQAAGARVILAPNSYYCCTLAGLGGVIPSDKAAAYAQATLYGVDIWRSMTAAGVRYIPADQKSLIEYVIKNPTLFGFTATSVLSSSAPASVPAVLAILTPLQQQTFLFIDGHHLTTAGQTIVADYNYNLLAAPSQISLITEGAVQGGLARTATIQRQIDLSWRHRGPGGVNVWTSVGAYRQKIKNASGFPTASGTPFSGSAGVDYQTTRGLIMGAALTAGSQRQDFSTGGHFDQTDGALSLYAAYKIGWLWGNAVASYGQFSDKITRQAPLGILIDHNDSDTDGHSQALALRAGGDIKIGPFTTGPVAGVVMQKVWLDSFRETGGTGVTALWFDSITRDSLVSQLGWRLSLELGDWQPFAEANWSHEWAERDRSVTAALTTVEAPSYSMAAVPVASDWATMLLGASYRLNSRVMLQGSASAVAFNHEVTSYGGELSVNFNF